MNTTHTTTTSRPTPRRLTRNPPDRPSPVRRFFGVVARPQSYRNLGYLLLGLPLGTIWFTVSSAAYATAISMLVVALLGIPMLWGLWYVTRSFANVERGTANALLGQHLAARAAGLGRPRQRVGPAPLDEPRPRSLARARATCCCDSRSASPRSPSRSTALATPFMVAYAPFNVRLRRRATRSATGR